MSKKLRIFLLVGFIANVTFAADDDLIETSKEATTAENLLVESAGGKKCDFTINCKASGKDISFEYVTSGNVCNQSNPGTLLLTTKKKRYALGIKGFSLKRAEDFGNLKQVCEISGRKYPARMISNNRLMLFIRSEALPGYDKLGAVLIDIKENRVVTFTSNLGQIKNTNLALLTTEKGLKTRLVKQTVKGVRCDCDAAYIDDWKEISVQKNLFNVKWMESKK